MATELLTPMDFGPSAAVSGHLFRKQILPLGSINYNGRNVSFAADRLDAIEAAFRSGAFDEVPLVLADAENRHTMDPRAVSGSVVDMIRTADGLDVVVSASSEAAAVLSRYPKIGISARVLEDYDRADGKHFPVAIQHALITTDPRITGLRPWEAVECSNVPADATVDLSGFTFEAASAAGREAIVVTKPDETTELTPTEVAEMRALLGAVRAAETAPDDDLDDDDQGTDDDSGLFTDDELEAIAAQALAEQSQRQIAASNTSGALELARARSDEMATQLSTLQARLDATNYEAERDKIAHEYGIPPYITDLARPLLEGARVIDLANGNQVDPGALVRAVFAEFGKQIKLLDLSRAKGSAFAPDEAAEEVADRTEFVRQARAALRV